MFHDVISVIWLQCGDDVSEEEEGEQCSQEALHQIIDEQIEEKSSESFMAAAQGIQDAAEEKFGGNFEVQLDKKF